LDFTTNPTFDKLEADKREQHSLIIITARSSQRGEEGTQQSDRRNTAAIHGTSLLEARKFVICCWGFGDCLLQGKGIIVELGVT
jgi:hypothetical protein